MAAAVQSVNCKLDDLLSKITYWVAIDPLRLPSLQHYVYNTSHGTKLQGTTVEYSKLKSFRT